MLLIRQHWQTFLGGKNDFFLLDSVFIIPDLVIDGWIFVYYGDYLISFQDFLWTSYLRSIYILCLRG